MKIKMELLFYIFLLSVAIAVVIALPPNVFKHAVFTEPEQQAITMKPKQCLSRGWSYLGRTIECAPYNSEHGMRR